MARLMTEPPLRNFGTFIHVLYAVNCAAVVRDESMKTGPYMRGYTN